ncbi:MAG: hypothetical protein NC517_01660 [Firmicutes bacterium]|nr:hypothetical protein [Bacillota bacterium]
MDEKTDTLFVCEFVLDRKKFLSWGKENTRRAVNRIFQVFWCVFATAAFAAAICWKYYFLLVLCVYSLYRGLFRWRVLTARQYSLLAKNYGTENWVRRISFEEDSIVVAEGNLSQNLPCSELAKIEEAGSYIRLHEKNGTVIRLYSDCFVTGTWEECREHLLSYTD